MTTVQEYLRAHRGEVLTISGYTVRASGEKVETDVRYVHAMSPRSRLTFYVRDTSQVLCRLRKDEEILFDENGEAYIERLPRKAGLR